MKVMVHTNCQFRDKHTVGGIVFYKHAFLVQIMSEYDQTFDPNILIGHCDQISRFSDFALYLGTQMVYEQTSFKVCLLMTRPFTLK